MFLVKRAGFDQSTMKTPLLSISPFSPSLAEGGEKAVLKEQKVDHVDLLMSTQGYLNWYQD